MNWWQRVRRRGQLERQLDAELRDHVDRPIADNIRAGMSDEEARRAARLEFGGVDQVKENCRDARATRWIDDVARDVRFAARMLLGDRRYTSVAVSSLALGIGACSMMFTIINAYYFRGLPVAQPERMLSLGTRHVDGREQGVSYPDYRDWHTAAASFTGMAAYESAPMLIGDDAMAPDRVSGAYVSAGLFPLLDVTPALGRLFRADDDRIGAAPVAILSHRLWTHRYGADASIVGRAIRVNGSAMTVVGVMGESFGFPVRQELWLPLSSMPALPQPRDDRRLGVLARLGEDVSTAHAAGELRAIAAGLAARHPLTNAGIEPRAVRFEEDQIGRFRLDSPPGIAAATAVFVLLIACANAANLLLARSVNRVREMAIRASVGATRWRIVRQLLVESLLLACVAGLVGFGLSLVGVRTMSAAFAGNVPYWLVLTVDARAIAMLCALCSAAGVLFGLGPALYVSRASATATLRDDGRTAVAPRVGRWSRRLVAGQFALTVVLLGGGGVLVRGFISLYEADRFIDASPVLTMRVELPEAHATPEQRAAIYEQIEARVAAVPGVTSAAVTSVLPFLAAPRRPVALRDEDVLGTTQTFASTVAIGRSYFDVLGVNLLRGCSFADMSCPALGASISAGQRVAIVNQLFVDRYFGAEEPIGRSIRVAAGSTGSGSSTDTSAETGAVRFTIVGIAPTIRQSVASGPRPVVYVPHDLAPTASTMLIVRSATDPQTIVAGLRRAFPALDAGIVLSDVKPLKSARRNSRLQPQLVASLLGLFAAVALALAGTGLYAVTAYAVSRRTREIGVRMALGARPAQIVGLFLHRSLRPVAVGVTIGLIGAFIVGALLQSQLVDATATDPAMLTALVAVLTGVAALACFVPAHRAARIDPAVTLRHD